MKKITLKKTANNFSNHPWIYKNHISSVDPEIVPGDIIAVISSDNIFLGTGYYNPKSIISVRILSGHEESIDKNFFISRVSTSLQKRRAVKQISNAYRIVSSEGDNLPGLIVDYYKDTAVFQINTLGMERLKNYIIFSIKEVINPLYIYEKSDASSRRPEGLKPSTGWHGNPGSDIIQIDEKNIKFNVNIEQGHKTGFYLDQRKARLAAGDISKDKKILDIFCYTGGFSIHAACRGAKEVISIDIKNEWLEGLMQNAGINNIHNIIIPKKGDAFTIMQDYLKINEMFDMIILDPPSFLKNKYGIDSAIKGYLELNRMAMRMMNENGILCTFSCSHHMRNEMFSEMLKQAAMLENKKISIVKRCHQDKDHPIISGIAETEYLKGYFLSIKSSS